MKPLADRAENWRKRTDVLEHLYAEVLAFIKHEDDKIGRVLTALAFLTAAGVSLFVFSAHPPNTNPLHFIRPDVDAADIFFAGFMVSLLFSLLFILGAVDPTSQIPGFLPHSQRKFDSILFYRVLLHQEFEKWLGSDVPLADLQMRLAESFRYDALELSKRAQHKVERFADSRAFVHVSIITLTLLGIARIDGLDIHERWWMVTLVLIAVSLLPIWDTLRMTSLRIGGLQDKWSWGTFVFLLPSLLAAYLLLASASCHIPGVGFIFQLAGVNSVFPQLEFIFVAYSVLTTLASRFILRNRTGWMRFWSAVTFGMGVLAVVLNLTLGW